MITTCSAADGMRTLLEFSFADTAAARDVCADVALSLSAAGGAAAALFLRVVACFASATVVKITAWALC